MKNQNQQVYRVNVYPMFKGFAQKDRTAAAILQLFGDADNRSGQYYWNETFVFTKAHVLSNLTEGMIDGRRIVGTIEDVYFDEAGNPFFTLIVSKRMSEIIAKMDEPRVLCTIMCNNVAAKGEQPNWEARQPKFQLLPKAEIEEFDRRRAEAVAKREVEIAKKHTNFNYAIGGELKTLQSADVAESVPDTNVPPADAVAEAQPKVLCAADLAANGQDTGTYEGAIVTKTFSV